MRKLAQKTCLKEGKRSQVAFGNMMESLNSMCEVIAEEEIQTEIDGLPSTFMVELRIKIESYKKKLAKKK